MWQLYVTQGQIKSEVAAGHQILSGLFYMQSIQPHIEHELKTVILHFT